MSEAEFPYPPKPMGNPCGGYYCSEDHGHIDCDHRRIELILANFPEVEWDRWAGDFNRLEVFGWITRDDGRSDFMVLRIEGCIVDSFSTSSATLSQSFSERLGWPANAHHDCKRVEKTWPHVRSSHTR